MTAIGQCPVLRTHNIAKEVVIIARKTDGVLVGRSADPVGFVNEWMELWIASEEGQNEETTASEGEKGIHFGHANHAFDEVEAGFFLRSSEGETPTWMKAQPWGWTAI